MSVDEMWRMYAEENHEVARLALDRGYFNACLQNVQQSVEKYLKAALIKQGLSIEKTHNIEQLNRSLKEVGIETGLTDDECDLLNAIYIPSKYPAGGVLPDFHPDEAICRQCVDIADKVKKNAHNRPNLHR